MNFSIEKCVKLLRKNFLFILLAAIALAVGMYYYTTSNAVPVYTAYTELYPRTFDSENAASYIGAERSYSTTYIQMLKTVNYSETVCNNLDPTIREKYGVTKQSVFGSMSVGSKNETEIITVYVRSTSMELALKIAEAVEVSANDYLHQTFGVYKVDPVENARLSGVTTVGYRKNVVIGFVLGALIAFFIVFIKDMYDYRLKSADEIIRQYNLPILGAVPSFDSKAVAASSKDKYGYRSYNSGKDPGKRRGK